MTQDFDTYWSGTARPAKKLGPKRWRSEVWLVRRDTGELVETLESFGTTELSAMTMVAGQVLRRERIRAKRQEPGLVFQHLTAVEAARTVSCAEVACAEMNSQTLEFRPGPVTLGITGFSNTQASRLADTERFP
jgi:hypothetical protein